MSVPAASFTSKQLRATIILQGANAVFPGTQSNTLVLTGLRMISNIEAAARLAFAAEIKIFGTLPADMNALTVVWFNAGGNNIQNNTVILEANNGNGWVQVFSGSMIEAQPDYSGVPNAFFRIVAKVGYFAQIAPVAPSSFPANVAVATVVKNLAQQMGFAFENNGVTATLHNPYFPGTAYEQLVSVCTASDTDYYFAGGNNGTLAICPSGMGRNAVPITILNPTSGLIGYPVIERFGLTVQCLFNPNIVAGGQVQISGSDIPAANGQWNPFKVVHQLESWNPGGNWLSTLSCIKWGTTAMDLSQ